MQPEYKKIVIFSDNADMCAFVSKHIDDSIAYKDISVEFYCSPFSDAGYFSKHIQKPVTAFNIKKAENADFLIANYDLIISIHCKQIFPGKLVESIKCVNLHPGYNPVNRGWYPQVFAIINGLPLGATLHEMTVELDGGPIIARQFVALHEFDTSRTAYERVVEVEKSLFVTHFQSIVENSYQTIIPEENGNLFMVSDFRKYQEIDMDKPAGTYREVIDHLRALSHPPFKNTYFTGKDGKKYYITLQIEAAQDET